MAGGCCVRPCACACICVFGCGCGRARAHVCGGLVWQGKLKLDTKALYLESDSSIESCALGKVELGASSPGAVLLIEGEVKISANGNGCGFGPVSLYRVAATRDDARVIIEIIARNNANIGMVRINADAVDAAERAPAQLNVHSLDINADGPGTTVGRVLISGLVALSKVGAVAEGGATVGSVTVTNHKRGLPNGLELNSVSMVQAGVGGSMGKFIGAGIRKVGSKTAGANAPLLTITRKGGAHAGLEIRAVAGGEPVALQGLFAALVELDAANQYPGDVRPWTPGNWACPKLWFPANETDRGTGSHDTSPDPKIIFPNPGVIGVSGEPDEPAQRVEVRSLMLDSEGQVMSTTHCHRAPCSGTKHFPGGGQVEQLSACILNKISCAQDEWEAAQPTPTSDLLCLPVTECDFPATEWEESPPTAASNRICTLLFCGRLVAESNQPLFLLPGRSHECTSCRSLLRCFGARHASLEHHLRLALKVLHSASAITQSRSISQRHFSSLRTGNALN